MVTWTEYKRWFSEHYNHLVTDILKDGAVECNGGASLKATSPTFPNSAPWKSDWAVRFPDGKYFRVKETYRRLKAPNAGLGIRNHFSFHYGTAHAESDDKGFPKIDRNLIPPPPVADLRIDIDQSLIPHIHVNSEEHLGQDRVEGFQIEDADMFAFVEAVRDHRRDPQQSLIDLLGIRVLN